jgi:hypothetical protein
MDETKDYCVCPFCKGFGMMEKTIDIEKRDQLIKLAVQKDINRNLLSEVFELDRKTIYKIGKQK